MIIDKQNKAINCHAGIKNVVSDLTQYFSHLHQSGYDPLKIRSIINLSLTNFDLDQECFSFIENTYSRTLLFSVENRLEIMIARWDKNTVTAIHGHPDFLFEYLIKGRFKIENYEWDHQNLIKTSVITQQPEEYYSDHGIIGRYDNAIHRIFAMEQSLSLHIYSDQGLKGVVFQEPGSVAVVETT